MRMMSENSVAILPSAPTLVRNRDVEHGFRQDSDFMYLSGFNEPESVIVLIPNRKQQCIFLTIFREVRHNHQGRRLHYNQ